MFTFSSQGPAFALIAATIWCVIHQSNAMNNILEDKICELDTWLVNGDPPHDIVIALQ